jgi:hypothetical protein
MLHEQTDLLTAGTEPAPLIPSAAPSSSKTFQEFSAMLIPAPYSLNSEDRSNRCTEVFGRAERAMAAERPAIPPPIMAMLIFCEFSLVAEGMMGEGRFEERGDGTGTLGAAG